MSENIHERYGPYPKKKGKKKVRTNGGPFLKRTFEWLKWKVDRVGGMSIYRPCLEHS